ncbi:inositol monophosphatase family protein [Brucella sp. NBRC 12950]|uniref:inositol monophosphatase family protein n=1 Tax=Brucella sp. NBRC 12950 TaxID=2994518 RepID=UPI0024A03570|nr:inositol monophosphatase family protein [Brucella sp. NBRC 12950]GLU29692.1 histidinol-phosphatase [Brucella sp. NBRC 12950]
MPQHFLSEYTSFALSLADIARNTIQNADPIDRRPIVKLDDSPVTATDRAVELRLREHICDRYPDHGILGEEFGSEGLDREFVWVLDPIDGTKAFVAGLPVFGTLISLAHRGEPVIGVIDNPTTGDRWCGASGELTTLNNKPIMCAQTRDLSGAFMSTGNPDAFDAESKRRLDALQGQTRWCVFGGSCIAYGRVADGSLDICIDVGLSPFDYCALVPIITGAGGRITDWHGAPLTIKSGNQCVASANETLHQQVLVNFA